MCSLTCRGEIEALQAGAEVQRKKALHTASVVGATCCALLQPIMDDSRFTIVILDESSQMTEAMSMIPLLRSKCRCVSALFQRGKGDTRDVVAGWLSMVGQGIGGGVTFRLELAPCTYHCAGKSVHA